MHGVATDTYMAQGLGEIAILPSPQAGDTKWHSPEGEPLEPEQVLELVKAEWGIPD